MDFFGRAYAKHKINLTWPYYCDTFQSVCHSGISVREATHNQASCNIKTAQAKQQMDYNNRHSNLSTTSGSKVLLQN